MLVLSRKKNQSVRIGDVVVTVRHVGRNVVRLGIEAPPEVKIVRSELPAQVDETSSTGVESSHGV